ncbi:protoporphyrinogen oxidase [bacterium]|nr:protoporphyrinogen oxidase [bacterium]
MIERGAVIGTGISGLVAAYFLQARIPRLNLDIYDAQDRIGGVIRSEKIAGCVVEGGPDSFLTVKKSAVRLCEAINLGSELVGSNDRSRKTYLFQDGELRELPEGFFLMVPTKFWSFLKTDLFTWPGKLEVLSDVFSFPEEKDIEAAEFLERRFGTEILQKIGEPMISGIYGANVSRLSLQTALPQIWEMQKKGSIIRQLITRKASESAESLFTTLENGMESLVARLQEKIDANWKPGHRVESVSRNADDWKIGDEHYDFVVLAGSLPRLNVPEFAEMDSLYKSIRRNSAVVVVLGFEGVKKEGFGWLVPASERRSILACTYVSNKFPRRSPENLFLVRVFLDGDQAALWMERSDDAIQIEILGELKRIAQIGSEPVFCRIFRWKDAMPEYQVGHSAKIERLRKLTKLHHGLCMTGNIFSGVGVPDCIQHAQKVVSEMLNKWRMELKS